MNQIVTFGNSRDERPGCKTKFMQLKSLADVSDVSLCDEGGHSIGIALKGVFIAKKGDD